MPKLPTEADFSRQTPSATRPIVSYQTGQVAQATQQLGGAMADISAMVQKEQDRLDDIRAEEAINQAKLSALELSHGENGFTKAKGEDVVKKPIREDYNKRFSQSIKQIEQTLGNPNQIDKFRRRSAPLNLSYQSSLLGHIGKETEAYQDQTDLATIEVESQSAAANWQNPQEIIDAKARINYTINRTAERKGLSADAKKQLLGDKLTDMHKGVITSMIESSPAVAKDYYKKNKKEINGLDRAGIEKALNAGTVKAESQGHTDTIISKSMSFTDSLKEARKIKDADVRGATVDLVKERFREMDIAEKEAIDSAGTYVAENKSLDGFPQMDLLPADKINSLNKNARDLRQGIEPIQDHKVWADFNRTVGAAATGDKDAINTIKKMDVYGQLRMKLDDTHYDQALSMQRAFVTNDAKEKSKAGSTAGQILTNKAAADVFINRLLGVKKTSGKGGRKEKGVRFADQFYQLAQNEIDQWGIDNPKKKIPPAERDAIFRNLAETMTIEDGGFMYFDKEYDITDIPEQHINTLANELRAHGLPVTGKTLVSEYLARKEAGEY